METIFKFSAFAEITQYTEPPSRSRVFWVRCKYTGIVAVLMFLHIFCPVFTWRIFFPFPSSILLSILRVAMYAIAVLSCAWELWGHLLLLRAIWRGKLERHNYQRVTEEVTINGGAP